MQESRLFKIVYYLLDKGQATALELAEQFEVSVRTIYRDIDVLSGAGIPIYTQVGRNGGIHLMNDFVLDKVILSQEEKQEILTALQSINTAQNIHSNQTLQKLSAMFHLNSEDWLEIDFSRWGKKEFDKTQIQQQTNGDFIVSAKMPEDTWLIGFLLSFGTQVEILSPVYLKEVIAEQANLIYKKNKP